MSLMLDFQAKTKADLLRERHGLEETDNPYARFWADGFLAHYPLEPAMTPGEKAFKLAGFQLFLEGRYPSGRAIMKALGKDVSGRVALNGRQCEWKNGLFRALAIEPFWWLKEYRDFDPGYLPHWRRGKNGSLVRIYYKKVPKEQAE